MTLDLTKLVTAAQKASAQTIRANAAAVVTKTVADSAAANANAKLIALRDMTPAQVQVWAAANITTMAQAQDAIATLAIAVSILARRL